MPIICGDCKEVIRRMDENSIDSIVTDPPAGIAFMNKEWDKNKGGRDQWIEWMASIATECYRVIKPGGHALVWALPRTSHWTATAWENGGFEVRDKIDHIFGSGFPKSMNIQQVINKAARGFPQGGSDPTSPNHGKFKSGCSIENTAGRGFGAGAGSFMKEFSDGRKDDKGDWNGWGTALKPAHEDWILLRKPLEGTVAQNILKWGVGGINIDGCRVEIQDTDDSIYAKNPHTNGTIGENGIYGSGKKTLYEIPTGWFPANLIHDGSDEVLVLFPNTKSGAPIGVRKANHHWNTEEQGTELTGFGDSGSAARFFYCAKPSKSERNIGCENLPIKTAGECTDRVEGSAGLNSPRAGAGRTSGSQNDHPTVKSINLMRYLCKLITPQNGIILDPFCGSGSTGVAAYLEGFQCIMIDKESHFCEIAEARMKGIIKENNKN